MARNYITFYAQQFGHQSSKYTTGFTRKIQADDPADVEASFRELNNGQMAGEQGLEDDSYGLSRDDSKRVLAIAARIGKTSVVLWVDVVGRANRTQPWGEEQLCPYLIYPVIFVARAKSRVKQNSLRIWPAIEATMAQLVAGLITDRVAQHCGHFIPFQTGSHGLYYSQPVAMGPKVEREAFELHIASGRFRGCPTFHQGDYDQLLMSLHINISR
ncbi:hypothetical protein FGB62_69g281 [Gracilaria domingensis]|nr:hypothetical protein FGB62_69g281 [Gracilaria domingensis]